MYRKFGRTASGSSPPFEFAVGPPPVVHYGTSTHRPVILQHPQSSRDRNPSYHDDHWQVVEFQHPPPRQSILPVHAGSDSGGSTELNPAAIPGYHTLSDHEQIALLDSVKNLMDGVRRDEVRRDEELLKAGQSATRGTSPGVLPSVYEMSPYRSDSESHDSSGLHHQQQNKNDGYSYSYSSYNSDHRPGSSHYPSAVVAGSQYGHTKHPDSNQWHVEEEIWPETPLPILPHVFSRQRPFGGGVGGGGCNCATYNNIGAFAGTTTLILNALLFVLLSIANGGNLGRQLSESSSLVFPTPSPEISHEALRYACDLMGYTESTLGDQNFESLFDIDESELDNFVELFNGSDVLSLSSWPNNNTLHQLHSGAVGGSGSLSVQQDPVNLPTGSQQGVDHSSSLCDDLCIETVNGIFPIGISTTTENFASSESSDLLTLSNFQSSFIPEEVVVTSGQETTDDQKAHGEVSVPTSSEVYETSNDEIWHHSKPSINADDNYSSASVNVSTGSNNTSLYLIQNQTIITSGNVNNSNIPISLIENLLFNANLTLGVESEPYFSNMLAEFFDTSPSENAVTSGGSDVTSFQVDPDQETPEPTKVEETDHEVNFLNSGHTSSPIGGGAGSSSGITVPNHQGVAITVLSDDTFFSTNSENSPETQELPARPNFSVSVTGKPSLTPTNAADKLTTTEEVFATFGVIEQSVGTVLDDGSTLLEITPTPPSSISTESAVSFSSTTASTTNGDLLTNDLPQQYDSADRRPDTSPEPLLTAWGDVVTFNELGFWKPSRKPLNPLFINRNSETITASFSTKSPIFTTEQSTSKATKKNQAPKLKEGLINNIPIRILETKPALSIVNNDSNELLPDSVHQNKIYGKKNPADVNALFLQYSTTKRNDLNGFSRPPLENDLVDSAKVPSRIITAEQSQKDNQGTTFVPSSNEKISGKRPPSVGTSEVSYNQYGFWKPKRKPISSIIGKLKRKYQKKKQKDKWEQLQIQSESVSGDSVYNGNKTSVPVESGNQTVSFMSFLNSIHDDKGTQIGSNTQAENTLSNTLLNSNGQPITVSENSNVDPISNVEFNEFGFWKPTKPSIQSVMKKWKKKNLKIYRQSPEFTAKRLQKRSNHIDSSSRDGKTTSNTRKKSIKKRSIMQTSTQQNNSIEPKISAPPINSPFYSDRNTKNVNIGQARQKRDTNRKRKRRVHKKKSHALTDKLLATVVKSVGRSLGSRKFIPRSDVARATRKFRQQFSRSALDKSVGATSGVISGRLRRQQRRLQRSFSGKCVTECWLGTVGLLGTAGGLAALAIPVYALIAANIGGISVGSGGGGGTTSGVTTSGGNSGGGGIVAIGPIVFGDDPDAGAPVPGAGLSADAPAPPLPGSGLPPGVPLGSEISPPAAVVPADTPFLNDGIFVTGAVHVEQTLDDYPVLNGDSYHDSAGEDEAGFGEDEAAFGGDESVFLPADQTVSIEQTTQQLSPTASNLASHSSFSDALSGSVLNNNNNNNNNNGISGATGGSVNSDGDKCDNFKLCLLHSRTPTSKRQPPRWYFSTYQYEGSISDLCQQMSARPTESLCKKLFPRCTKKLRPLSR